MLPKFGTFVSISCQFAVRVTLCRCLRLGLRPLGGFKDRVFVQPKSSGINDTEPNAERGVRGLPYCDLVALNSSLFLCHISSGTWITWICTTSPLQELQMKIRQQDVDTVYTGMFHINLKDIRSLHGKQN